MVYVVVTPIMEEVGPTVNYLNEKSLLFVFFTQANVGQIDECEPMLKMHTVSNILLFNYLTYKNLVIRANINMQKLEIIIF